MRQLSSLGRFFAALSVAACAAIAPAADRPPELRYRFKAGETIVYNVEIVADYGDYVDILSGTPSYHVESADADGIKLTFRGGLVEKSQLKPDKKGILMRRPQMPFSPFTGVGSRGSSELTVNDRGEVISSKGTSQLPYLMGRLSLLMLDSLPKEPSMTWKNSTELNIVLSESGLPRPLMRNDDRKLVKATREVSFTLDKVDANEATFTRKVELTTTETVGGKPRIEIVGEGKLTFDRKAGAFRRYEGKQKVIQREANKWEETPLTVSFRLLSEAERKELAKTAEGTVLLPTEAITDDLRKQALADLKSGDKLRLLKCLSLLSTKGPPDGEPDQVTKDIAKAIEEVRDGGEKTMRFSASKALVKWATKDSTPGLIKALDSDDLLSRHMAMDALAQLKSEEAAGAIAKRLAENADRFKARKALETIGPKVEPELLKLANHSDWTVRSEVCQILGVVGSDKCVATLNGLANDSNLSVKRNAKMALEAVQKRK